MISLGILFLLFSITTVSEGIILDVVVFDYYPHIYGLNFVFYGIALIMLIWGIVELVQGINRRKRHILRGQSQKNKKIPSTSTALVSYRATPSKSTTKNKRKKKR